VKAQTITAFGKRFGLSRATLLYYDRIGLLKPGAYSEAGYRLYTDQDAARMTRIDTLRRAGLPLRVIRTILDEGAGDRLEAVLEQQLVRLNAEMAQLQAQQRLVVELLQHRGSRPRHAGVGVDQWVRMLEEAGMDEAARRRWHAAFERDAPDAHEVFLRSIGLSDAKVVEVRRLSRDIWPAVEAEN